MGPKRQPPWRTLLRALRWPITIAVVVLAVVFIRRQLSWQDVYRLPGDPPLQGVALTRRPAQPPVLVLADGGEIALSPAQESSVVAVRGLRSALGAARPHHLALAATLSLICLGAIAVRWCALVRLLGGRVPLGPAWRVTFEAQGLSLLLPGALGGDVYRAGWLITRGIGAVTAALSVLLDRAVGLWVLLFAAATVAQGSQVVERYPALRTLPWLLAAGLALGLALAVKLPLRLVPLRLRERTSLLRQSLIARPWALLVPLGCSLANNALFCATILLLLSGFSPVWPSWSDLIVRTSVGMVANTLPLSPGGVGVGEAAMVYSLGQIGVPAADVLATMLLIRAVTFVLALVALAGQLWRTVLGRRLAPRL